MEYLTQKHPLGSPDQLIAIPDEISKAIKDTPLSGRALCIKIWYKDRLIYANDSAIVPLEIITKNQVEMKDSFPWAGCTTYSLFFDYSSASSQRGERLLLTSCTGENHADSIMLDNDGDNINCYYSAMLGDYEAQVLGKTKILETCDDSLDYFGGGGHWGLPRPTRLLVFDEAHNAWRPDKPGEFPAHYVNQTFFYLDELLHESLNNNPIDRDKFITILKNKDMPKVEDLVLPADLTEKGKNEAKERGRQIMRDLMAHKSTVMQEYYLDTAFAAYAFIMMGLSEREVKKIFPVNA